MDYELFLIFKVIYDELLNQVQITLHLIYFIIHGYMARSYNLIGHTTDLNNNLNRLH